MGEGMKFPVQLMKQPESDFCKKKKRKRKISELFICKEFLYTWIDK